ncbi:uncharacterized protein LOC6542958 [Drosophila erecta]|uniref:Uncharacterized protein n=1 Tax=Drosophila erecta TaxID=7220 RepID=B3N7X7_DROER|nr:uncharacterized protein LOC6542958 [Drosophila erecta]EDV58338.1 uncharacterized protein Dere_GG25334 [Drosophila erecta]
MRSRTELVTTTFEESDEEDFSPDDSDSEEDWRPTKKRPSKPSGSDGARKRKSTAATATASKAKRRMAKVSDEESDEEDDLETEPSDDDFDFPSASTSKRPQSLPPKKQFVKLNQLDLLVKKSDLMEDDWLKNNRLCLWRKDEQTNLLQKYLRVKSAAGEEELLFTSSSVYSSCDDQQTSDFIEVKVNCLDPNNRRIKLHDLEAVKKISVELQSQRNSKSTSDKEDDSEAEAEEEEEEAEEAKPNEADS